MESISIQRQTVFFLGFLTMILLLAGCDGDSATGGGAAVEFALLQTASVEEAPEVEDRRTPTCRSRLFREMVRTR
ncbi:MAG: hypothetical protein MPW17_03815 [Candidatus Manganitrophus sp.]|nr:hypothetical protein [Candidatus Manganitrophus sp.]WDT71981.1 MAG: hypothetical protein MPW17_03815 [Candidatus Manganitrophus sp.]